MATDAPPAGPELPASTQALLDAVVAISSALEMHQVLDRIVASACELTGATYGALGVIGADGTLSDFITHGLTDEERARIGDLPRGRGILGLLIEHPEPLRLEHLQDHPRSYGLPPHHPPMTSFLGVPVRIRGTVFGNLYLTEKRGGHEFSEQDETLVQALATTAGFVIDNARAYAVSERQRAWLEAAARLHDQLQPPVDLAAALPHIAAGALAVSGASAVGILQRDEAGEPVLGARDGRAAGSLTETVRRLLPELDQAFRGEQPDDVDLDKSRRALVVPLRTRLFSTLVLLLVVDSQHAATHLPGQDHQLVTSFAEQAALALDRAQALVEREELAIVTDRDRIARDLHDIVIQRLFATGLQLQGARAKASPIVQERLDQGVAELDATIRDIRGTIFQLQHHQAGSGSLRHAVHDLVGRYRTVLGFPPDLRFDGPVDTLVDGPVREQLLAVLREALSNVAKHAAATTTTVRIAAGTGELVLEVSDDGVGLPDRRVESGLRNVRRRAAELDGAVRMVRSDPRGTMLEWRVPLG